MNNSLNSTEKKLLETITETAIEEGAINLRANGHLAHRFCTQNVKIKDRQDGKKGIDVFVKSGTKQETVYIPVLVTQSGHTETVYNDFYIGDNAQVTIIAGCGIHNSGESKSQHDGVHTFIIGKNAKVNYSEKHYGSGTGNGAKVLNPITHIQMEQDSYCEMNTVQIEGVSTTIRKTTAYLGAGAKLNMVEKLLTHGGQTAISNMDVFLNGSGASARIISRSVAKENSRQEFRPAAIGNSKCRAYIQCDSIIMDDARVKSIPVVEANHRDAQIVHEAAIGRINNEQLIKLETLGMTQEEAEQIIIDAFLE